MAGLDDKSYTQAHAVLVKDGVFMIMCMKKMDNHLSSFFIIVN